MILNTLQLETTRPCCICLFLRNFSSTLCIKAWTCAWHTSASTSNTAFRYLRNVTYLHLICGNNRRRLGYEENDSTLSRVRK